MSALSIQPPYPLFTDIDGQPLEDGFVWLGVANLDPQTNPVPVYLDAALTLPAAQPIRTLAGYPANSGTPARLYVNSDYSIRVMNKNGSVVYSAQAATERYSDVVVIVNAGNVIYDPPFTNAVQTNVEAKLAQTVSVKDFGAVGDGVADDWQAIRNAIESIPVGQSGAVYFPMGDYYCSQTLKVDRQVMLFGPSNGAAEFDPFFNAARIIFPSGVHGLWVLRGSENSPNLGAGDWSVIQDIAVVAQGKSGYANGIQITARASLVRVSATGFSGNGINIDSTAPTNNANLWRITDSKVFKNGGHGLYINGGDANAGVCIALDASANGGWGIYDSSFLGNTYIGCHTDGNILGPYYTDNANAPSPFIGCYSESNQPPSVLTSPSLAIGGQQAAGVIQSSTILNKTTDALANRTSITYASRISGGSGYTSAPTVTFDAPTGTSTAAASATVVDGKIVSVAITDPGAGYGSNPTVTITDSTGSGASAVAQISAPFRGTSGALRSITVVNGGSGYSASPTITISAPTTTTATGTALIDSAGTVTSITITNKGSGYTSAPNITLSGGGGSGASFTAILSSYETQVTAIGGNQTNGDVLFVQRGGVQSSASITTYRLRFVNNNTGDLQFDLNGSASSIWYYQTGPFTNAAYGRANPVAYAMSFPKGVWLNGLRNLSCSATVPPTSGEYARGDTIFAQNPSAGGSPGVVCTTGGTAGSTAVFKAMANIAA